MLITSEKEFFRSRASQGRKNPYRILPEEGKVWKEFKRGSKLAYSRIYKHYINVLYNYGYKFIKDKAIVEDCIQDLFFELWESKEKLSDTDSIKFYLMKALRNKILKEITQKKNKIEGGFPLVNYDFHIVSSYEEELVTCQLHQEQKEKINNALNQLSVRQKEAIFLRYFDGLSFEETAGIMSINLQSAHNLVYKAIKILRESLSVAFIFLMFNSLLNLY